MNSSQRIGTGIVKAPKGFGEKGKSLWKPVKSTVVLRPMFDYPTLDEYVDAVISYNMATLANLEHPPRPIFRPHGTSLLNRYELLVNSAAYTKDEFAFNLNLSTGRCLKIIKRPILLQRWQRDRLAMLLYIDSLALELLLLKIQKPASYISSWADLD